LTDIVGGVIIAASKNWAVTVDAKVGGQNQICGCALRGCGFGCLIFRDFFGCD